MNDPRVANAFYLLTRFPQRLEICKEVFNARYSSLSAKVFALSVIRNDSPRDFEPMRFALRYDLDKKIDLPYCDLTAQPTVEEVLNMICKNKIKIGNDYIKWPLPKVARDAGSIKRLGEEMQETVSLKALALTARVD